jgi:hypothetical protein
VIRLLEADLREFAEHRRINPGDLEHLACR